MKVCVAGDFYLGERIDKAECGFSDRIGEADFAIVNFESPVCDPGCSGNKIVKDGPHLKCRPDSLRIVKEFGFDAVALANNHILDYGADALAETIRLCDRLGLGHVGAGKNASEAAKPLFVEKQGIRLAIINCCENEFSTTFGNDYGANPLNPVRQFRSIRECREKADFVMVIVHGGPEYCQLPTPRMVDTYRFFVEAGADVVINHHQHCYSGYDIYQGKPIFYGLGNFLFPPSTRCSESWHEGYMVQLDLDKSGKIDFKLLPYRQSENGRPCVRELNDRETEKFEAKIAEINSKLQNLDKLERCVNAWYDRNDLDYRALAQNRANRWLKGLMRRGLLPTGISSRKAAMFKNFVGCESHRDRFLHMIGKEI